MSFFVWDDTTLSTNVDAMDDEHKEIVRLMNKLWDANEAGESKAKLTGIIDELGTYTVKHFQDEEAYMEKINFPSLDSHKFIHKDLLEKFGEHKAKFEQGSDDKVQKSFFDFLKLWLTAHIQGIDKKYGEG